MSDTEPPRRLDEEIKRLEERLVRESLERNGGNLSKVARELGIARPRLYRILKRVGVSGARARAPAALPSLAPLQPAA